MDLLQNQRHPWGKCGQQAHAGEYVLPSGRIALLGKFPHTHEHTLTLSSSDSESLDGLSKNLSTDTWSTAALGEAIWESLGGVFLQEMLTRDEHWVFCSLDPLPFSFSVFWLRLKM